MSNCQVKIETQNNVAHIHFTGTIDETFNKTSATINPVAEMHFHMGQLALINSTGIREWIILMKKLENSQLYFHDCPKAFIDQVNMVKGFINPNSKILSFYVPFFSSGKNEEKNVLYTHQKDYQGTTVFHPEAFSDTQSNAYEIDVISDKYFKFLKTYSAA